MRAFRLMLLGGFLTLAFIWLNVVLWGGRYFDSICIGGQLHTEQAVILNSTEWRKCKGCRADEKDRVFKYYCSDSLRSLWDWDVL